MVHCVSAWCVRCLRHSLSGGECFAQEIHNKLVTYLTVYDSFQEFFIFGVLIDICLVETLNRDADRHIESRRKFFSCLEITRIASQFAIQYMSVAMQSRFCIAVGCDAKTTTVLLNEFFFYYFIHLNRFSRHDERTLSLSPSV
jgi:hypothetical protein